jgi:hypothetical protein
VCVCMYVYMYVCVYVCVRVFVPACVRMSVCACVGACIDVKYEICRTWSTEELHWSRKLFLSISINEFYFICTSH